MKRKTKIFFSAAIIGIAVIFAIVILAFPDVSTKIISSIEHGLAWNAGQSAGGIESSGQEMDNSEGGILVNENNKIKSTGSEGDIITNINAATTARISIRPDYGLSSDVFSSLPQFPKDFYDVDASIGSSSISLPDLEEKYYLQPEFFPTWEDVGVKNMLDPPTDRIGIWGLGAYPAEQLFSLKAGEQFTTAIFFHTSWMVQTRQGIELASTYDNSIFDVEITPSLFVLGRSYPAFDKNWVQKIILKIKVDRNASSGTHTVSLTAKQPPQEFEQKWRSEYKNYVNAPSATPDSPFLKLNVKIEQ